MIDESPPPKPRSNPALRDPPASILRRARSKRANPDNQAMKPHMKHVMRFDSFLCGCIRLPLLSGDADLGGA